MRPPQPPSRSRNGQTASRWVALAIGLALAASSSGPARAQEITQDGAKNVIGPPAPASPPSRQIFPLWSDLARERNASLPMPYGLGVVLVQDQEGVFGDHLSVRLAKGQAPPQDATLIAVAPVTFDNVGSTRSVQIKADVWVLPFLNLFASLGKVDGDIAIDVVIDADALLPPPVCRPAAPCGIKHLYFTTPLDNTTTTLGATLVYGSERWFVGLTGSRTISIADTDRSDIKSTNIGLRGGPRLVVNDKVTLEPYVGVNYFHLNTEVRGVASQPDVFPDGDALEVRYDARVENTDDHALTVGLNAQIGQRIDLQGEYGHADSGDRFILSTTYRF